MRHGNRIIRRDIIALMTASLTIELGKGQYICETDKAFEIWQETNSLNERIKRYSKMQVLFTMNSDAAVWNSV
jgi:hypothetical protein